MDSPARSDASKHEVATARRRLKATDPDQTAQILGLARYPKFALGNAELRKISEVLDGELANIDQPSVAVMSLFSDEILLFVGQTTGLAADAAMVTLREDLSKAEDLPRAELCDLLQWVVEQSKNKHRVLAIHFDCEIGLNYLILAHR